MWSCAHAVQPGREPFIDAVASSLSDYFRSELEYYPQPSSLIDGIGVRRLRNADLSAAARSVEALPELP